jgi:hypothetical protein
MPAMTKRREPRFRAYVPVVIYSGQVPQVLVPHDISTSGCYFDVPPQIGKGKYHIQILVNGTAPIDISDAEFGQHEPAPPISGFYLKWTLDADNTAKLFQFLKDQSNQPSTDAKVAFLTNEQGNLVQAMREIGEQKQKGYRFLFVLVAAYFGYLAAPLHFTFKTVEQAAFYASGGVWASVVLLHHSVRFLSWLGRSVRRNAFLGKAVAANRSWVLDNDGSYYAMSLFPSGTMYDDARSWTWINDKNAPRLRNESAVKRMESFPFNVEYNWSTTFFHFLVQALFVFGAMQFLSIIERTFRDPLTLVGNDFRLFDGRSFSDVYSTFSIVVFAWILICGNACTRYQQRVWEARRISFDRPNPRFTRKAFREHQTATYVVLNILMYVVGICLLSVRMLIYVVGLPSLPRWAFSHINWTVTGVLALFLVGKIVYGIEQMNAEKNANREARTLRDIAKPQS